LNKKHCVLAGLLLACLLSACASWAPSPPPVPAALRLAPAGLPSMASLPLTKGPGIQSAADPRFPPAMSGRLAMIRQRWNRGEKISISKGRYLVPWVTAWNAHGSTAPGKVCVFRLRLIAVDANSAETVLWDQSYDTDAAPWGGWWEYDDEHWFTLGKVADEEAVQVGWVFRDMPSAAVLDTGHFSSPTSAGHIWAQKWPRLQLPDWAVQIVVEVDACAFGAGMFHFGLDQYQSEDSSNETPFEPMGSWTYAAEHGMVRTFIAKYVQRR